MNELTEKAKSILINGGYTATLCSADETYFSTERGVKPLIDFLESGKDFSGFSAADKTVGLGAAHLYVLLGVKSIWANIASTSAVALLKEKGIDITVENEVPYIINRKGDGPCPIESAVLGIGDSQHALMAIRKALKVLTGDKK